MNQFVNALAIRRWAEQIVARYTLPQVLRRLVFGTLKDISVLDFPAHESAQRSAFDGEVECATGNAWVPDGRSVWEMGVNRDVKGKADEDYEKRTKETPQNERFRSTYVALTPRHWENKDKWAADQRSKNDWKDVRAYDADDLEQWAETAPAVAVWFGRILGTRPEGVDDIDSKWKMLSTSTSKDLVPAVFLGARVKEIELLKRWSAEKPSLLCIKTRSPGEGIDFFIAFVASLDEEERDGLASRCVIIESNSAWKNLRDATTPMVLIVDPSINLPPEEFARAVGNGHHVLISGEFSYGSTANTIPLTAARQFELVKALEACGFSAVDAEQHARAAGGSLAILKRRLAKYPTSFVPSWASSFPPEPICGSLLVGGWDERNEADRAAVERLAGRPYADLEPYFLQLSSSHDPLLLHADRKWRVISKDEAWVTFGNRVTEASLAELEKVAVEILTDDDPRFDLDGDKRHFAQISGHVPKYSTTIKEHVATTVAMLGALGAKLHDFGRSTDISAIVDRIVAKVLPPNAAWQRWASLGNVLPMLAEASPREFLRAVKDDLALPQPVTLKLFEDEEGGLFGRCNHAGLLWALESLAWSKQYVCDACLALLRLDSGDAGKRWANRPRNSLAEILSGWVPQTMATVGERVQLLDRLIEKDAEASWPLLLELLPGARHMSMPTHKPYWRNWATEWEQGATHADYRDFALAVGERVAAQCGHDAERLVQVIERLTDFPEHIIARIVAQLQQFGETNNDDASRRSVSEALKAQLRWLTRDDVESPGIEESLLKQLEELLPLVQPRSIVQQHAWLFDAYPSNYYDDEASLEEAERKLWTDRQMAIVDISAQTNFAGLVELAKQSSSPDTVGVAVALATGDRFLSECLSAHLSADDNIRRFVDTFFAVRFRAADWDWADSVLAKCEAPEAKAQLLATFPLCSEAWSRAQNSGNNVSELYWNLCRSRNSELEPDDIEFATGRFLEHGRVFAAIELLQSSLYAKKHISSAILCHTLESLLQLSAGEAQPGERQNLAHSIRNCVTILQDRSDIDELRLARLELALIDILDGPRGSAPRTLQRLLSTRPELYAEALAKCYRSTNEDRAERPPLTDLELEQCHSGYKLLHCLDSLPGKEESGAINENVFRDWCNRLRALAAEGGRAEICDSHIGQLIAHAPAEADGTWPCTSVRRVLEEIQSEDLADGIICGIRNSRGVVARGDDGEQERTLAAKYRSLADRIRFTSPFVAQVLDQVAESYDHEGQHWDEFGKWHER